MIKRLIAILILVATMFSIFGCDAIKQVGGHKEPEVPDSSEAEVPETQETKYVYSVLSKSIHLEGCYHINEIKEEYKKEVVGDISHLLEKEYTLCKDCFPPQIEVEPEEEEPQEEEPQFTDEAARRYYENQKRAREEQAELIRKLLNKNNEEEK